MTIQVIPYSAGAHPAMDNMFNILEFGDGVPSVVYVEGLMGWLYIERPQDINRYRQVFEQLHAVALNPQDSIELMAGISAQFNGASILASHKLEN